MTELLRVIAVVALLCVAAAICTPRGRLPLVLRGLKRTLGAKKSAAEDGEKVPSWRKMLGFLCVVAAVILALLQF